MKHFHYLVAVAVSAFVFTSCAHTVLPVESLYNNYNLRMDSKDELEIKSNVLIFCNEKDIKGDYSIISMNHFHPFTLLPFNAVRQKKLIKRFFEKATTKAYEEGGNAILIRAAGFYDVLNLADWNPEDARVTFVNPIFSTKYSDLVKSGALAAMKRSDRVHTEKAFMNEIEDNVANVKTLEEIQAVREKIKVLSEYNLTLKNDKSSIEKVVKKSSQKLNRAEKKIKRALEKAAQAG